MFTSEGMDTFFKEAQNIVIKQSLETYKMLLAKAEAERDYLQAQWDNQQC